MHRIALPVALSLCLPRSGVAQSPAIREVAVALAGPAMIYLSDQIPRPVLPTCGPCDRSEVPFFDRWVIHEPIPAVQATGYAILGAFMAYSWIDIGRDDRAGFSHVRASFESALFSAGVTGILKEAIHRKRQIWYTSRVTGQTNGQALDNMRSMPSGDTGIAFALVTSYVMSRGDRLRPYQKVLAYSAASLLGLSRIVGGKHYPTDVLAGAAIGVGSAWLVHQIRF